MEEILLAISRWPLAIRRKLNIRKSGFSVALVRLQRRIKQYLDALSEFGGNLQAQYPSLFFFKIFYDFGPFLKKSVGEYSKKWASTLLISATLITLPIPYGIGDSHIVHAGQVDDLQNQLNGLNQQIDTLNSSLAQKRNEKASLENDIAIFDGQIRQLGLEIQRTETEIRKTQLEIAEITQKIKETEAELERQKELIREYLRVIYEEGRVSVVEVVVSTDDFSEFLNKSEYLQTMQRKIQETAEKINQLKDELKRKKASLESKNSDLTNMRNELNGQKADLDLQRAKKDALLAQTKGQEAVYAAQLGNVQSAYRAIQGQIDALLNSNQFVSYGNVKKGQIIGYQGSTGFSTGSHLHFGVYRGSSDVDPMPYLNNGTLGWPLVNPTINQTYWGGYSHKGAGLPGGVDMIKYHGAPVRASAPGNIIYNGVGPGFGHHVIIDHGNGLRTLYAHLQ